jgi:hypothetical protein
MGVERKEDEGGEQINKQNCINCIYTRSFKEHGKREEDRRKH